MTVSARDGLVVVVPRGVVVDTDALVEGKRSWAARALERVAHKRALFVAGPDALLPREVSLPACDMTLSVRYESTGGHIVRATRRASELVVTGASGADARLAGLVRWLDRTARDVLPVRLETLSARHGLGFSAVRVTGARSRWGSCSARGTISLNRALLFLPAELCDAVLVHELAHTRVMNHSPRFWSLLSTFDPDALAHRAQLRSAADLVPAWADI